MTRCSEESDQASQVSAEVASSSNSNMRTDSGVITEQPSSSRTRSSSHRKPKRGPWETYLATKPLMPAGKSNQSRMVSSRRHSIEVSLIRNFPLNSSIFLFQAINGSIKHNVMFKQRMDLQKLRSGFGPACFKLMAALHNRRFIHQKRVMDMNPKVKAVKSIPYSD